MRPWSVQVSDEHLSLSTEIRLYNVYILPVLLYGADVWSITVTARRRLDAFDQWCLRHILRIAYIVNVSNLTARKRTNQRRVTSTFVDDDDDDGRINFNVAYSPKTSRTRNS